MTLQHLLQTGLEVPASNRDCSMKRVMSSLTPPEREALNEAISKVRDSYKSLDATMRKTYTVKWIYGALTTMGYDISQDVVSKHIRLRCACGF